ncbi:MAG: hypothetical protein JSW38_07035 [Dehalococcoidia bacterium]|nr:MAG: hypothetical protein JSW38_07035 [Dehalococcoidia bacterium]
MAASRSDSKYVVCPNRHPNPNGSKLCNTCGLPIVDYETELESLLKAWAEQEPHIKFSREKVFIGVGNQGCKLVHDLHRSWGNIIRDSEFLMIESSGETGQPKEYTLPQTSSNGSVAPRLSLHLIPRAVNSQVGYFGLGDKLARDDPGLDDRLRRSGVNPSTEKQTVLLLSALGGGTGSGASPYTLQRAREINPHSRRVLVAMMPGADEPDSAHFNSFCSLSHSLQPNDDPVTDILILANYDRLSRIRGVSSSGEELARESLLSHLVASLAGAVEDGGSSESDPGYLAKMGSSMGVHAFVPCLAIGRSLEIFGSIGNILESAFSSPLAPIDTESIVLSYILVQVPDRMASSLHEKTLRADLNRWNKNSFPQLKGSVIQLSHSLRTSDRVDLYLLLGGTKLAITASRAKEGFDRFKSVVGRKAWEQEFGVTSKSLPKAQEALNWYDTMLKEMAS